MHLPSRSESIVTLVTLNHTLGRNVKNAGTGLIHSTWSPFPHCFSLEFFFKGDEETSIYPLLLESRTKVPFFFSCSNLLTFIFALMNLRVAPSSPTNRFSPILRRMKNCHLHHMKRSKVMIWRSHLDSDSDLSDPQHRWRGPLELHRHRQHQQRVAKRQEPRVGQNPPAGRAGAAGRAAQTQR